MVPVAELQNKKNPSWLSLGNTETETESFKVTLLPALVVSTHITPNLFSGQMQLETHITSVYSTMIWTYLLFNSP